MSKKKNKYTNYLYLIFGLIGVTVIALYGIDAYMHNQKISAAKSAILEIKWPNYMHYVASDCKNQTTKALCRYKYTFDISDRYLIFSGMTLALDSANYKAHYSWSRNVSGYVPIPGSQYNFPPPPSSFTADNGTYQLNITIEPSNDRALAVADTKVDISEML